MVTTATYDVGPELTEQTPTGVGVSFLNLSGCCHGQGVRSPAFGNMLVYMDDHHFRAPFMAAMGWVTEPAILAALGW